MNHYESCDVNEVYFEILTSMRHYVQPEDSRNGKVLTFPEPVLIAHRTPWRRVLFDAARDANPFFHYMEAIWMLAGARNVHFPARFASNMTEYSDDNDTLHGAYGWRWRNEFQEDQLPLLIAMLQDDPTTRRAVLQMWAADLDLATDSKDVPCNTHAYFRVVNGDLDMTVCNRSNDLIWGCLGANVVHMSILHEYVAEAIGRKMGTYYQFTNNLHIYEKHFPLMKAEPANRWYNRADYDSIPFSPDTLHQEDAADFCFDPGSGQDYDSQILNRNAIPMYQAWLAYKDGNLPLALHHVKHIYDEDWGYACELWLTRRRDA
jgi:thymidylate synthase